MTSSVTSSLYAEQVAGMENVSRHSAMGRFSVKIE
jgi:hypothetical protein